MNNSVQYQNPTVHINLTPTINTQGNVSPDPEFVNIIQTKTAQAVGDEFRNMILGMQATAGNNWNLFFIINPACTGLFVILNEFSAPSHSHGIPHAANESC